MKFLTHILSLFFVIIIQVSVSGQTAPDTHSKWVNQQFHRLSFKQKISQLFMVAAYSNKTAAFEDSVYQIIKDCQPGGLIFFQGGPQRQARVCNRYQDALKVKALVAMDAEWGLGMRLDSTVSFPYQMALGAIRHEALVFNLAKKIAGDLKRMGVHVNFAPVIDVNNNRNNPVINFRSFGENKYAVARKGLLYVKGIQSSGIMATVKHFPGHGDTEVDSHQDLPVLNFTRTRLDSLELYPFEEAIRAGVGGMMVAHMYIPALDTTKNLPSTLSQPIINGLLKRDLGFKGLVFTDAMNMKGVVKYFLPGQAAVRAIDAGNDMVEMSTDIGAAIKAVKKAVKKGILSRREIKARCRKILAYKERYGLSHYRPMDTTNLVKDLNGPSSDSLNQQLADSSLTVLRYNADSTHPKMVLCVGPSQPSLFENQLATKWHVPVLSVRKNADQKTIDSITSVLKGARSICLGVHETRIRPRSILDYSVAVVNLINRLSDRYQVTAMLFANPYTLAQLSGLSNCDALAVSYQDSPFMEKSAVNFFTRHATCSGKLPVGIAPYFYEGDGIDTAIYANTLLH